MPRTKSWRAFTRRDRDAIEAQLEAGMEPACPACQASLYTHTTTRMFAVLPPGAIGYDLDCDGCHRFCPRIQLTSHAMHVLRMHRLAAAVQRA
jgi:hypothetical protein